MGTVSVFSGTRTKRTSEINASVASLYPVGGHFLITRIAIKITKMRIIRAARFVKRCFKKLLRIK